jgi:hypothetical protein
MTNTSVLSEKKLPLALDPKIQQTKIAVTKIKLSLQSRAVV